MISNVLDLIHLEVLLVTLYHSFGKKIYYKSSVTELTFFLVPVSGLEPELHF
mgnify:FL=1